MKRSIAGASARAGAFAKAICIAACFNLSYLMLAFLIPLYAVVALHYSLVGIGFLAALPSILQVPVRLFSGAISDVWGERPLLRVACGAGATAGLLVAVEPHSLAFLVLAQLCIGLARGVYWVPMQSYLTRLPGDPARALGHLISFGNVGSICGILLAGPLAAGIGFRVTFAVTAATQLVALGTALALPDLTRGAPVPSLRAALMELPRALTRPILWFCGGLALLSAIPQALVQSFYPVYLTQLGQAPAVTSALSSLRSVGMICVGLLAALIYRRLGEQRCLVIGGFGLAGALALTASGRQLPLVGVAIFGAGALAGFLDIVALTLTTEASLGPKDRGALIALNNTFFALAMLLVPSLFGLAAAHLGLGRTFVDLGVLVALAAVLLAVFWRWLGERAQPAAATASR